ncbi:allergen Asp F4-like protein [Diaporthe sp. PMI_573]|nr:allergen Asp F4-like protein [Diaporthaceae sp. PMI_573]
MARLAASLLLLGAIGASAHPSGHARFHNKQRSQNQERAIGDTIDAAAVAAPAASSASPTPTPVSSSAPKATSDSSSTSTGEGITEFTTFTDLCSAAKKRATLDQIKYAGNVGSSTDYGCNKVLLANSDLASDYNNTAKFFGATEDLYCLVWNKIGEDGGINGFFGADATTFKLPAGSEQYVAFDKNSQGGGACFKGASEDDVEKTVYGAIAGTWAEWDFENDSNQGWSGYDASAIVAQAAGLAVSGMEICAENAPDALCSTITSGGASFVNAYRAVDADADGIGGQVSGPMKIAIDLSGF